MAKFGINDILNAKTKAAGQQAQTEGYLSLIHISRKYVDSQQVFSCFLMRKAAAR